MGFTPEFDNDLWEKLGDCPWQHLNPQLYATELSAHQLADLLADLKPTVVKQNPFPSWGGRLVFNHKVPFLQFPSLYTESAGALQLWWVRCPEPEGLALRYCKAQIASDEKDWLESQSQ